MSASEYTELRGYKKRSSVITSCVIKPCTTSIIIGLGIEPCSSSSLQAYKRFKGHWQLLSFADLKAKLSEMWPCSFIHVNTVWVREEKYNEQRAEREVMCWLLWEAVDSIPGGVQWRRGTEETKTLSNNALKGKFNPIWAGRWGGSPARCHLHNQKHLKGLQLTAAAPRWHAGCSSCHCAAATASKAACALSPYNPWLIYTGRFVVHLFTREDLLPSRVKYLGWNLHLSSNISACIYTSCFLSDCWLHVYGPVKIVTSFSRFNIKVKKVKLKQRVILQSVIGSFKYSSAAELKSLLLVLYGCKSMLALRAAPPGFNCSISNRGCILVTLLYYLHDAVCREGCVFGRWSCIFWAIVPKKQAKSISIPPQQFSLAGKLPKLRISTSAQPNLPHPAQNSSRSISSLYATSSAFHRAVIYSPNSLPSESKERKRPSSLTHNTPHSGFCFS